MVKIVIFEVFLVLNLVSFFVGNPVDYKQGGGEGWNGNRYLNPAWLGVVRIYV